MPPRRAPFPTGTTTARRRVVQLVEDLVRDRAVALVLRGLGTVLEEGEPVGGRMRARFVLRSVEVRSDEPDLGAKPAHELDLRLRSPLRRVHDRSEADALSSPRRRRTVVARRCGHDRVGSRFAVGAEHRQRSTPLEGAQLVDVLTLEQERAAAGQRGRRGFERRGRGGHEKSRPGFSERAAARVASPSSASARKVGAASITGTSLPNTSCSEPSVSRQSRRAGGVKEAVSR